MMHASSLIKACGVILKEISNMSDSFLETDSILMV